jgi:hypothetical protein
LLSSTLIAFQDLSGGFEINSRDLAAMTDDGLGAGSYLRVKSSQIAQAIFDNARNANQNISLQGSGK